MTLLYSLLDAITKHGLFINWPFEDTGCTIDDKDMTVNRMIFTNKSTIGELWIDGKFVCYTLEDTCRNHKIDKITAIPAGRYQIAIDHSVKFNRDMPHLLDVPNYEGIRIHWGNKPEDTDGCILVGQGKDVDFITASRTAFDLLFPMIEKKLSQGPLFINILGGVHEV